MRKVVVVEYMSLDGVIQAPGHPHEDPDGGFDHGGWTGPFMDDHRRYMRPSFQATDALLLGRVTYEIFAAYWPIVRDDDDDIARTLNTRPKYVASTTLHDPHWTATTVIKRDVAVEVAKLKEQPGKDILVVGSSTLAQTLMRHNLVDEYRLWMHPIVLGRGKRLFRDGSPMTTLRLVDTKVTSSGLVILTYEPAGHPVGEAVEKAIDDC